MQRFRYTIIILSLFAIGLCTIVLYEELNHQKSPEVVEAKKTNYNPVLLAERMKYIESIKDWLHFDLTKLVHSINQQWKAPEEAIPFTIKLPGKDSDYLGLYYHESLWEIKGENEGSSFILEKEDNQVQLSFEHKKEKFSGTEFDFLLPSTHFFLLADILENREYEMMEWSKMDQGWEVRLNAQPQLLSKIFYSYLEDHFKDTDQIAQSPITDFTLTYRLQVAKNDVRSLEVVLEKHAEVVEEIQFQFN